MRRNVQILASYLGLFALIAAPWLVHAAHALPINCVYARADTRLLTWILWWVGHALVHAPAHLLDAPINYPAPQQITGSEHFAALQLVFLPVYEATGNAALAMNAILFLSYPAAAFAMNRLLCALGIAPRVCWVSGLAFALGALQVPANVHMLHTLAFYLPAVALALHRLRERDGAGPTAALALLVLLGFFTAYYTAAILLLVIVAWTIAELLRPLPGRWRFAARAGTVVLGCLALLALASLPYLARGAALEDAALLRLRLQQMNEMTLAYLTHAPVQIFGGVSLVLAAAGCAALRDRRRRALATVALALVAASVLLISGAVPWVVSALPGAHVLLAPLTFFRVVIRYAALAGFGLALLGALALERACARLPRDAARALLVVVAVAVTAERGRLLFHQQLERSRALTVDAPAYRQVAATIAARGRGPLLEMPLSSFGYSLQPEAMIGEMQHQQPLIVGHTGYLPPHRALVDATIARLPADDAMQELVDMTHLRWLLVRPPSDWGGAAARARFVHDLERLRGVARRADVGGFTLLEIARTPVASERFARIARPAPLPAIASLVLAPFRIGVAAAQVPERGVHVVRDAAAP